MQQVLTRMQSGKRSVILTMITSALFALSAFAADSAAPQVSLNVSKAAPRAVEELTEKSILRDYKFAWANMAHALESNSTALLNGSFAGTAQDWLTNEIATQQHNGLTSRYLNQTHKVDAAFYSPEGDVIELHDTAGYDLEILDGSKTVHNEHVVLRYVVLMTPGADHWVVRQLQSVPQF
jgi:hypothetical protein